MKMNKKMLNPDDIKKIKKINNSLSSSFTAEQETQRGIN
jgi:hypothetical protein